MSHKLSASALSTFLKSPRQYYYRYILRLEPIQQSVVTYDHDKLFGTLWAQFVDRFYKGFPESSNTHDLLSEWHEHTDGWVPEKAKDRLTKALETLAPQYYQMFSPEDGCRTAVGSELWLENDRFCGRLDGLSADGIVHEVKSTSRAPQMASQLWKVENSIQVRLYCVLAEAKGYRVEFAFKDAPYQLFRGPEVPVSKEQRQDWEQGLNVLADSISALGTDPHHYVCHTDCNLITKNVVSMCAYQPLCEYGQCEITEMLYKNRDRQ
jgi:hypothetical protein